MIGLSRNQHPNDITVRNTKLPVLAALSGVAVGALAALAVTVPTMQHNFALQTKDLQNKLALTGGYTEESQAPAEVAALPPECVQAGGMGGGEVLGASTVAPSAMPAPGMGGVPSNESSSQNENQQQNQPFVKKLVSGTLVKAEINNTGPYSSNSINTTVENKVNVNNTNDIQVNNQVDQWAQSGSTNVSNNTNAGSATSGAADNSSSSSYTVTVNNNN